ncbi:MAG TPA: DUF1684 domain-containing protein [Bacteroidales bacterium]|nr:DUF1684 domain-containing protein [Bacteroidales bacterium]
MGSLCAQPSKKEIKKDNVLFRAAMNKEFADSTATPLTKEGLKTFKELDFFQVKAKYRVVSRLVLTPDEKPFEMPRSKGNTGTYRKYGEATFKLNGKECKLSVYQYMKLINDSVYKNDLFLPFKDLSNGRQTYGGGRFLDLKIPEGEHLVIDFNKAYNPLCCYGNPRYSCPIPPEENHLEVKILAGEKNYKGD